MWSDEFDGPSLDGTRWGYVSPGQPDHGGDLSDPLSITVVDGLLTDTVFTDSSGIHHIGMISTSGKFQALYGYVESRIQFHGASGEWCGFWMQPAYPGPVVDGGNSGTEIDVLEHRAYDNNSTYIGASGALNLNWNVRSLVDRKTLGKMVDSPTTPLQNDWHVYGLLWTPEGYTWFIDGYPMWTTNVAPWDSAEYLLLTCQVMNMLWAGPVPPGGYGPLAASTTGMQVDWVRVWQPSPSTAAP